MNTRAVWFSACVLLAGCGVEPGDKIDRIDITETNDLGVTRIETQSVSVDAIREFELRGFDADGQEQALIRLRTGDVPSVATLPGSSRGGSEITMSGAGFDREYTTRELRYFNLPREQDALQGFLDLGVVNSTLQRANIHIPLAPSTSELAFHVDSCPPRHMLSSPLATQCCYETAPTTGDPGTKGDTIEFTKFINTTTGQGVVRASPDPNGGFLSACTDPGGVACSGAACVYGPVGYAHATFVTLVGAYKRVDKIGSSGTICTPDSFPTPPSPASYFGNITGSNPTNLGCPGGTEGYGDWDY